MAPGPWNDHHRFPAERLEGPGTLPAEAFMSIEL
jgi:hypothetical protein